MADFYVIYNGQQYDVENFDAGVAKAKELGASAVFHVEGALAADVYAEGVTTIVSGGDTGKVFGGSANGATLAAVNLFLTSGTYGTNDTGSRLIGVDSGTVQGNVSVAFGGSAYLYGDLRGAENGATVNGNVYLSITGGNANKCTVVGAYGDGTTVGGDVSITISGGKVVRGVWGVSTGATAANSTILIQGGNIGSSTHQIRGVDGGSITGTSTIRIENGLIAIRVLGVSSGSAANSVIDISGGTFNGDVNGVGGGSISDNVSVTVSGGEIAGNVYGVGGKSTVAGNVATTISGGTIAGEVHGVGVTAQVSGTASLTITGGAIGGTVYAVGGSKGKANGGATLTVTDGLIAGDIITVTNGHKRDVNVNLLGGTFAGSFDGAASLVTGASNLNIGAEISTSGTVANFSSINFAAEASLSASTITAEAITIEVPTTDGLYTLASGFAPQASVVTVVDASGGQLGTVLLSQAVTSGSVSAGQVTYTVAVENNTLTLDVSGSPTPPPTPTSTVAEVILTITDPNHDYYGATGGWKVQNDQTVAWQDLTTLGAGYSYLGLGVTAANKAMPDIYIYNADAKYIAAYTTDATGAITGFESIFAGEAALMQVGLADFNADGVSDLLLRTADGFVGYYANGAFAEVQGLGTEWTVAALGDVDGNGRADVIIAHAAGYVGAYLIGNDGSISWADLGNLDSNTQIVGAGDVNGDGTDDVIVQVGANYFGAWTCTAGAVTGFFGIGTFDATVQDIADYNADGKDDLLLRTASGMVGAALISGADATTWAEYGALGSEWSTKGVGIL